MLVNAGTRSTTAAMPAFSRRRTAARTRRCTASSIDDARVIVIPLSPRGVKFMSNERNHLRRSTSMTMMLDDAQRCSTTHGGATRHAPRATRYAPRRASAVRRLEDARVDERGEQVRVDGALVRLELQNLDRALARNGSLVRTIGGGQRVVDVGDRHHPRLDRDVVAADAPWIALA